LFEPDDVEASVSWKHVVPLQYNKSSSAEVKSPVASKQFTSTSSKIDAWRVVVANSIATANNKHPRPSTQLTTPTTNKVQQPVKQTKQPKTQQPQPQPTTEEKPVDDEITTQNRYKTELCKSFTETGNCRYGNKCQFAHGKEEIRPILRHPKYKTEICKTFHTTGTCPYGIRCRFIHTRSKEESIVTVSKAQQQPQQEEEEEDIDDDVVPQWSKSWTMSLASAVPSKNTRVAIVAPEPAF